MMDDGAFEGNFAWFEWGFVSPDDVPNEERWVTADSSRPTTYRAPEQWDEDHRWQT